MEREGELLEERPPFKEVSPGHWVEACPVCYGGEAQRAA